MLHLQLCSLRAIRIIHYRDLTAHNVQRVPTLYEAPAAMPLAQVRIHRSPGVRHQAWPKDPVTPRPPPMSDRGMFISVVKNFHQNIPFREKNTDKCN